MDAPKFVMECDLTKQRDKAFQAEAGKMGLKLMTGTAINAICLLLLVSGGFAAVYHLQKRPHLAGICGLLSIMGAILWWRWVAPWTAKLRKRETRCPVCGAVARVAADDELVCSGCGRRAPTSHGS